MSDDINDGMKAWQPDAQVQRIRSLKGARGKVQELAIEFDCSDHIIWKIMNRKTWAHVPEVLLTS